MARRKIFKKQAYQSFSNCFDSNTMLKGKWRTHFSQDGPLILELGCGKAELSYALAKKYPTRSYVGIDLKMDRMWRPAKDALEQGISNIAFLCIHLLQIDKHFDQDEVDTLWITFPDPFPKTRQIKHRMINPHFLRQYASILKPGGRVHFKTDNLDLFHYSLTTLVRHGNIRFQELSFDLHEEETLSDDIKIETTYEQAFREMGKKIYYTCWEFI